MPTETISEVLEAFNAEMTPIPTGPITAEEKLALLKEDRQKLRALVDKLSKLVKQAEA
ncbi:hypothetical protein [Lewinella sp. W8]|uniref:hypothetical protein n=1 Tax=Lewinella sp. W8 TaxID=2528208 RepID=UPI0012B66F5B|nr:hypothetical protein [Lewinella sp. W8]MTB50060.1 hypothetical protein [Lewinella sp. W8]